MPHLVAAAGRALLASAVSAGALLAVGAQSASAAPVTWTETADYVCQFPQSLKRLPTSVAVTSTVTLPSSVRAGVPTEATPITFDVQIPQSVAERFALFGIATLESPDPLTGPVSADAVLGPWLLHRATFAVDGPSGRELTYSGLLVPSTNVAAGDGGTVSFRAVGELPSLTSETPGVVIKHNSFVIQLIARSSEGEIAFIDDNGIDGGGSDADSRTFEVDCVSAAASPGGARIAELPVTVDMPIMPPTVTSATSTATTVEICWAASTGGDPIVAYRIYEGTRLVATVTQGRCATIPGLQPDTSYAFSIEGETASGRRSPRTTVTVRTNATPPPTARYSYLLAGSASLKTLTKGNLPLKGSIDAELTLSTGAFSADLVLADTQGRLTALGFLPVTAKIGFAPSGLTTGTLLDGVLSSNSKVRIKVKEVKLFGAIPLAGGNSCQTKSLSDINLKSTDEFKPLQGGTLAGTFAISDLNGCGALNGLVSPLTAGGGNTINLKLTPKPTA